jgi:hypothetical protein
MIQNVYLLATKLPLKTPPSLLIELFFPLAFFLHIIASTHGTVAHHS